MTRSTQTQVSESQIAVHWREEEQYAPPPALAGQANASDPAIPDRLTEDRFPGCLTEHADLLEWDKKRDTVPDTGSAPFWNWFAGGNLNASCDCVVPELETGAALQRDFAVPGETSTLISAALAAALSGRAYRHGRWRCTAAPAGTPRPARAAGSRVTARRPARVRGPWITSGDRYLHTEGARSCPA